MANGGAWDAPVWCDQARMVYSGGMSTVNVGAVRRNVGRHDPRIGTT